MLFTLKRLEFVAKYLSDISKLFFTAGVVKQFFGDEMNLVELIIGNIIALILFAIGFFLHPKE